jgi:hypothetical protein
MTYRGCALRRCPSKIGRLRNCPGSRPSRCACGSLSSRGSPPVRARVAESVPLSVFSQRPRAASGPRPRPARAPAGRASPSSRSFAPPRPMRRRPSTARPPPRALPASTRVARAGPERSSRCAGEHLDRSTRAARLRVVREIESGPRGDATNPGSASAIKHDMGSSRPTGGSGGALRGGFHAVVLGARRHLHAARLW